MNVYEAAVKRVGKVFDDFDQVIVAFSGGKDSGVLFNLALAEVKKRNRKLILMHLDYEAQYQQTTDYVDLVYNDNKEFIEPFRICLPFKAQCSTSMHQDHWRPWCSAKQDIWVRKIPDNSINEHNNPFHFWNESLWDYDVQEKFAPWLHKQRKANRTAVLVGIRTDESLNRWRAIHSDRNWRTYEKIKWSKKMADDVYNFYPIFDWSTEDIWTANAVKEWSYNKLYDLFYQAGVPLHSMRVASPFNDYAKGGLDLYRAIDPNNWARMVGRVNGANFTAIYGSTTAMGWRGIKLPKGHTWKSYMYFLLDSLPEKTRMNYLNRLEASKRSWLTGGAIDKQTIKELEGEGAPLIRTGRISNRGAKNKEIVQFNDYLDDTGVSDFKRIPTYKRMCICIMKNDHLCKYMGFAQTKIDMEKRLNAIKKYSEIL